MSFVINTYTGREFVPINNSTDLSGFKYHCPRYDFHDIENVHFFTLSYNNVIVGLAHIRKNPHVDNTYWLSHMCILDSYQNKGLSSKLSEYIFTWFKDNDLTFETSSYSKVGFEKLKPLFNKLSEKIGISFIDKDTLI